MLFSMHQIWLLAAGCHCDHFLAASQVPLLACSHPLVLSGWGPVLYIFGLAQSPAVQMPTHQAREDASLLAPPLLEVSAVAWPLPWPVRNLWLNVK